VKPASARRGARRRLDLAYSFIAVLPCCVIAHLPINARM
jgi:hypothetical protein